MKSSSVARGTWSVLAVTMEVSTSPGRGVSGLRGGPVLEARGLSKFYGSVLAVQDISFCLEPGQVMGYLGPNGSGKSTTVKMLTGLLEPSSGQVIHDGEDIHKNLAVYRKCLG